MAHADSSQANQTGLLGLFQDFVSTPSRDGDTAPQAVVSKSTLTPRLGFRFSTGLEAVTITDVDQHSPAAAVGLRPGDVILSASQGGQGFIPVDRSNTSQLISLLQECISVTLRIRRDDRELEMHITKSHSLAPETRTPVRYDVPSMIQVTSQEGAHSAPYAPWDLNQAPTAGVNPSHSAGSNLSSAPTRLSPPRRAPDEFAKNSRSLPTSQVIGALASAPVLGSAGNGGGFGMHSAAAAAVDEISWGVRGNLGAHGLGPDAPAGSSLPPTRGRDGLSQFEDELERIKARHAVEHSRSRDPSNVGLKLQVQQLQEAVKQERRRNTQLSIALQEVSEEAEEAQTLKVLLLDKERHIRELESRSLSLREENAALILKLKSAEDRLKLDEDGRIRTFDGKLAAPSPPQQVERTQSLPDWSTSKMILEEEVSSLQQQLGSAVAEIGNLQSRIESRGPTGGQTDGKHNLVCALEEGAEAISTLQATISDLEGQLRKERQSTAVQLAKISELESQLKSEKDASAAVREALLDAGGLAEQLQETQQQLENVVLERRKWEHKYRKLQQEMETCKDKVRDLELRLAERKVLDKEVSVARGDVELKRHALREQEMTLVSVMRDAGAAVASKASQERMLVEAVMEASLEAQKVKEALDGQKEIEEQLEFQYSIVTDLTLEHRRLNELVMEARKAAVAVRPRGIIPIRLMGALDTSPGGVMRTAAAQGRFGASLRENEYHAARLAQLLRDPSFHPFTTDSSSPHRPQEVVNRNDARLEEVRRAYGSRVAEDVVRAVSELNRWNASGRYPVEIPWNREEERELTPAEVVSLLAAELAPLHMRMMRGRPQ